MALWDAGEFLPFFSPSPLGLGGGVPAVEFWKFEG
jgi:hypothetical protein